MQSLITKKLIIGGMLVTREIQCNGPFYWRNRSKGRAGCFSARFFLWISFAIKYLAVHLLNERNNKYWCTSMLPLRLCFILYQLNTWLALTSTDIRKSGACAEPVWCSNLYFNPRRNLFKMESEFIGWAAAPAFALGCAEASRTEY